MDDFNADEFLKNLNKFDQYLKSKTNIEVEEEKRKQILLEAIREDVRKKYEQEAKKIDENDADRFKKLIALGNQWEQEAQRRTDAAVKALENNYQSIYRLERELEQVNEKIKSYNAAISISDSVDRQKKLNEEKIKQMQIEAQIYEKRMEKEKEFNNFQKTIQKRLENDRNEEMHSINERYENLLSRGMSKEEADATVRPDIDNANSKYENSINELLSGKYGKIAQFIGNIQQNGVEGYFTNMAGDFLGNAAENAATASLGPVAGKIIGEVVKDALGNIISILKSIRAAQVEQVDAAMKIATQYLGPINTRLQGSDYDFKSLVETMQNNLSTTVYVSQKKYLDNLNTLVEKGVAYNLEERAMLMTVGDKIATTFDALDESLGRLIRLQQADLTRSSLGSEASLTTLLNAMFRDTSYMNNLYDDVSSTVLEATSQMNPDQATSFTYAVQKWLGALYSVGLSDTAVRTIAEGINFLSTGDVSSLNSNSDLQTLIALAASKSGKSISSMLTTGMYAEDVDDLMMAMIGYLADIANNTSSQVMKSEWADIVNLSISDLRAFSNLTSTDIATLYNTNNLGYRESLSSVNNQMQYLQSRTTIQERLDNFLENIGVTYGFNITDNDQQYLKFMLPEYMDKLKQGMGLKGLGSLAWDILSIPFDIVGINTGIEGMAETLADMIQSLVNGGTGIEFDNWNNSWNSATYNSTRGSNYSGIGTRMSSSSSGSIGYSEYARVANFEETQARIEASGTETTERVGEVSDTIDKLYTMLFETQKVPIKVYLESGSDEFFKEVNDIIASNTDNLSDDVNRYITNSSTSVQNLTTALYGIRGV